MLNGQPRFEAAHHVIIGVENMPSRRFLGRRASIYSLNDLDVLAGLPHITLDTTHLGTWGLDPLAVYEQLQARITHVHLSNSDGKEHQLPEHGRLPLGALLRRLSQAGYQGAVSLEFNPNLLQADDEKQVGAHLRRTLRFCRHHLAG